MRTRHVPFAAMALAGLALALPTAVIASGNQIGLGVPDPRKRSSAGVERTQSREAARRRRQLERATQRRAVEP